MIAGATSSLMALGGDDRYETAHRQRRRRTKLTDTFLSSVADAYRAAPEGERIASVREKHPASESQVYRWLKAARDRGILTDGEGGDDGER